MAGAEEGGLEIHFVDLANGLSSLGDDVVVIAHERYRDRFAGEIRFLPLDLTRSRRNPWLQRTLRRLIESVAADVVHAHAGKAAALVGGAAPSGRTVATVHGRKRDLSAYRLFDAVIGVSQGAIAHLDHPAKTVVYNGVGRAPNAVSTDELRRQFGIDADTTVTLAVGRLVPVKGYHRLIDLWNADLGHLIVVGDGPERARLEARAEGKPVTLAGFRADVRSLMGAADLMVIASEREGFGSVLAEALLARLPVVSTPVGGAKELLPGRHLADIGGLRHLIAATLADTDAARERLRGVFDWAGDALTVTRMVASTRAVYCESGARSEVHKPC